MIKSAISVKRAFHLRHFKTDTMRASKCLIEYIAFQKPAMGKLLVMTLDVIIYGKVSVMTTRSTVHGSGILSTREQDQLLFKPHCPFIPGP